MDHYGASDLRYRSALLPALGDESPDAVLVRTMWGNTLRVSSVRALERGISAWVVVVSALRRAPFRVACTSLGLDHGLCALPDLLLFQREERILRIVCHRAET